GDRPAARAGHPRLGSQPASGRRHVRDAVGRAGARRRRRHPRGAGGGRGQDRARALLLASDPRRPPLGTLPPGRRRRGGCGGPARRHIVAHEPRVHRPAADALILAAAQLSPAENERIAATAHRLVAAVRRHGPPQGGIEAFLQEYRLSTPEGVALMCLAEALLRIPDSATVDRLIRDKIATADWQSHLGHSGSVFVNASTWALMLTGRMLRPDAGEGDLAHVLHRLVARSGEPLVRQAVLAAMRILGRQFVMGRTIGEALERARPAERHGYRHSYDMLGEAARTAADA